ncbi:UDP-N-acetylglucosamine transferase subunit ALG14 [Diabrotica undecimpunctata]|uniref:UDP-N-acetylglucosamine transferase subunit ALG14 n=1 Tax=Diabrotica undecimpunctata TaxID=50387 RepID=UPI003B634B01
MDTQLVVELCILLFIIVIARILFLIHKNTTGYSRYASEKRTKACKTVICIGSGGHTTEMLSLIENIDFNKYSPRYYIIASSDTTSLTKVEKLEESKSSNGDNGEYYITKIPRSRVVHQSYFTSIFTTLFSILYSIPLVLKIRPDLILCNGPGTCIPICGLGFLLKCAFITNTKIVFIESFCRTKTLSLTGKILIYLADNFLVQWPSLKQKVKRADYIGQLM